MKIVISSFLLIVLSLCAAGQTDPELQKKFVKAISTGDTRTVNELIQTGKVEFPQNTMSLAVKSTPEMVAFIGKYKIMLPFYAYDAATKHDPSLGSSPVEWALNQNKMDILLALKAGKFLSYKKLLQNNNNSGNLLTAHPQTGHLIGSSTSGVLDIIFSSNNKFAATLGKDNSIRLWDIKTGKEIRTFSGFSIENNIWKTHFDFSPNGKYIGIRTPSEIYFWDIETGKEALRYPLSIRVEEDSQGFSFHPTEDKVVIQDSKTKVYDLTTKTKILESKPNPEIIGIAYIGDGKEYGILKKMIPSYKQNAALLIFNSSDGQFVRQVDFKLDKKIYFYKVFSTSDNKYAIIQKKKDMGKSANILFFDFYTPDFSKIQFSIEANKIYLEPEKDLITAITKENGYKTYNYSTGKLKQYPLNLTNAGLANAYTHFNSPLNSISNISFCNDKMIVNVITPQDGLRWLVWDLPTLKMEEVRKVGINESCKSYDSQNSGLTIKTEINNGYTHSFLFDSKTNSKLAYFAAYRTDYQKQESLIAFSPTGKYAAINSGQADFGFKTIDQIGKGRITIYDLKYPYKPAYLDKNLVDIDTVGICARFYGHDDDISCLTWSKAENQFYSGGKDGIIKFWDIYKKKELAGVAAYPGKVVCMKLTPNNEFLVSAGDDGQICIHNPQTLEIIVKLVGSTNGEWIAYTPDFYFDASPKGGELLAMVNGLNIYNIDQFAIHKNRPDILLQRIGSVDQNLITHYYKQYQKRIKKAGLNESISISDIHTPNAEILRSTIESGNAQLEMKFTDTEYNLTSYSIFVNDVPIFGVDGKSINGKLASITETIKLIPGENKVEVSCKNDQGFESYRSLVYFNNNSPSKPNLYLLAYGVSKYNDPKLNLQFADKDATDLSKVIETYKGKGFENVYTKVLTNEQVTPEAIKASKDFVKNAKPDDTFILFIAGHGMHDKDAEATYYYLTSNADINNLKGTAADFETIEDLLQGIPPRNKLFLMDACESGEIDEEDQGQMIAAATGAGIASRGFKTASSPSTVNTQPSTKRSYLYQKDRYIYNDLVRRSGAIVFSSSKGGELSYERSDIENGLFTEYIMKALTTTEADRDNNGVISTDELREYVSAQVAKASGDLQHPTVDRDNIYQKFGFQVK